MDKDSDVKVVNLDRDTNTRYGEHQETPLDYQRSKHGEKYGFVNYLDQELPSIYQDARKFFQKVMLRWSWIIRWALLTNRET